MTLSAQNPKKFLASQGRRLTAGAARFDRVSRYHIILRSLKRAGPIFTFHTSSCFCCTYWERDWEANGQNFPRACGALEKPPGAISRIKLFLLHLLGA